MSLILLQRLGDAISIKTCGSSAAKVATASVEAVFVAISFLFAKYF